MDTPSDTDPYGDNWGSAWLNFHWGKDSSDTKTDPIQNYPLAQALACISAVDEYLPDNACTLAVDIGCGPGRSSFELTKKFSKVIAIDSSPRFINFISDGIKTGKFSFKWGGNTFNENITKEYDLSKISAKQRDCTAPFTPGEKTEFSEINLLFAGDVVEHCDSKLFLDTFFPQMAKDSLIILTKPIFEFETENPIPPLNLMVGKLFPEEWELVKSTKLKYSFQMNPTESPDVGFTELCIWKRNSPPS